MTQYFICNSSNFLVALEWAGRQAEDGNVQLTAYCEAQSDRIMKNPDGLHQWDVPYDFARTAACVMRLGMLMATGLEPTYYHSNFGAVEENTDAFVLRPARNLPRTINDGQLLAASRNQTRLFFSYFDTMYTKHYIMALLLGQPRRVEQRRNIQRQMIVVSPNHNVIWQITASLYIVSNGQRVLNAKPFIAVWRYDRVEGRDIVPLDIPPRDDDDGDKKDLDFENVVERIKNMCLKK